MQDAHNRSESVLDQKLVQQDSEILLLKTEVGTLKKRFEQLRGIHSKCKSQKEKVSVGIQTDDEVCNAYNVCSYTTTYSWVALQ